MARPVTRRSIHSKVRRAEVRDFIGLEPFAWHTALAFTFFAVIVLAARWITDISEVQAAQAFLLPEALADNVPLLFLVAFSLAAISQFGRGDLFVAWGSLDRGYAIQTVAGLAMFFLTWRFVAADYDYVFREWHVADRAVLIVAAALALYRPIFLLLFIVEIRLLQAPIRAGFDFDFGTAVDDLPILALIAIAAVVLLAVAVGHRRSDTLVPLLSAAVAIQFVASGRAKLPIGWFEDNDLSNVPLNGYQQGWLGSTDGGFSEVMSDLIDTAGWPVMVGVLLLQVGAIALIVRRKLLMAGLVGWIGFHIFAMAGFGFSFLEWALVELGFFLLLADPIGDRWSKSAFKLIPVAMTMVAIVLGGRIAQPPDLVWFDGPVTYTYEFNGTDTNGNQRLLVANDFAPHEAAFAFGQLHLGPTAPVAAGYGALDQEQFEELENVRSMAGLAALETTLSIADAEQSRARSVENIVSFLEAADREHHVLDYLPDPLDRFWTSRTGGNYEDRLELVELAVTRVTELRVGDVTRVRREFVATFIVTETNVDVVWATEPSG